MTFYIFDIIILSDIRIKDDKAQQQAQQDATELQYKLFILPECYYVFSGVRLWMYFVNLFTGCQEIDAIIVFESFIIEVTTWCIINFLLLFRKPPDRIYEWTEDMCIIMKGKKTYFSTVISLIKKIRKLFQGRLSAGRRKWAENLYF